MDLFTELGIEQWQRKGHIAHEIPPTEAAANPAWDSLKKEALACTQCALHKSRTHVVFGVGNEQADLLVIGEAPGANEDRQGEPFVGRAGQLLNAMLYAIGFERQDIYIANILKCRPPNNRDPDPEEIKLCSEYLFRQIELIQPKAICVVGRIAAQTLMKTQMAVGKLRGKVHLFGEKKTPLVITYHPAYLLRTPEAKRKSFQDLQKLKSLF